MASFGMGAATHSLSHPPYMDLLGSCLFSNLKGCHGRGHTTSELGENEGDQGVQVAGPCMGAPQSFLLLLLNLALLLFIVLAIPSYSSHYHHCHFYYHDC